MMLYNETKKECKYGHFDTETPGGYTITGADELTAPWYYIYQNRKILLYVDQNGPVKIQYQPPAGILVTKRELGENQSKWQIWVQSKEINDGVPVSNFNYPRLAVDKEKPKFTVTFTPTKAIYKSEYANADIITEIFVPVNKATVSMKTTVANKTKNAMTITVVPAVFPYVNVPQMVAWDLPEWYLSSKLVRNGKTACICGLMRDSGMDDNKNRSVTFNMDLEEDAQYEMNMGKFVGSGNFFAPKSVIEDLRYSYNVSDIEKEFEYAERQAVWTAKYKCTIEANASKTYTQVLSVQDSRSYSAEENAFENGYFDEQVYTVLQEKAEEFYHELFSKRTIKTNNKLFDNFINYFTPLQMYWVCSLDRGWPSAMRGTRDASQDFVGMLAMNSSWTRETILKVLEHQRTDGWFPRQISIISRESPHDMRNFCDGGAFFLELVYEYLTYTRDACILKEKVYWLDSNKKDTVLTHVLRCVDYYLNEENIGEHGLCKAWYGDWWDVIDHVGLDGIGETVTVTAQMVLNLKNLAEIFRWLVDIDELDESYIALADKYVTASKKFAKAMNETAYNTLGYYNGYFNDHKKWLFSENDPDGCARLYLVSNAWAIMSGVADKQRTQSVLENIEKMNLGRIGYNTNSLRYQKRVDKAGRVGNGSIPEDCPYNHAQSFFVRACCIAGDAENAYKATRYIYPIEEVYAPVEKTFAPPYAIANAYSNSDANLHRIELQFLSGTVS